jgi:hypothetical protein
MASDTLREAGLQKGIARGMEGIGKTRLATICAAGISLQRSLPALRDLVDSGKSNFQARYTLLLCQLRVMGR